MTSNLSQFRRMVVFFDDFFGSKSSSVRCFISPFLVLVDEVSCPVVRDPKALKSKHQEGWKSVQTDYTCICYV